MSSQCYVLPGWLRATDITIFVLGLAMGLAAFAAAGRGLIPRLRADRRGEFDLLREKRQQGEVPFLLFAIGWLVASPFRLALYGIFMIYSTVRFLYPVLHPCPPGFVP